MFIIPAIWQFYYYYSARLSLEMARIGALFGRAAAVGRSGQADSDSVRDGAALQKVQVRVQVDGSLV